MSDKGSSTDKGPTQSQLLLSLFESQYSLVRNDDSELFAIPRRGPNVAVPFGDLSPALSGLFRKRHGKPPSNNALQEAKKTIESFAPDAVERRIPLRFGRDDDDPFRIYIDMGNREGETIEVTPRGWKVLARSPYPFRRTSATRAMFDPREADTGDITPLSHLFNVNDAAWDFLVAWLVTCCVDGFPHICLMLRGRPGSAKSTLVRMLTDLVDPSRGAHSGAYEKVEDLISHARGSAVIGLENVWHLPGGISDTLSRLVTGEAWRRRKLYTNSDVHITTLRRTVIINGIEVTGAKQDLRSRSINVNLRPISDVWLEDEDVEAAFESAGPAAVRALLDILALTLKVAKSGRYKMPASRRMASHLQWLRYVDVVRGTAAAEAYIENSLFDAQEGAEDNAITLRLVTVLSTPGWIARREREGVDGVLTMRSAEWLAVLGERPRDVPSGQWPISAKGVTAEFRLLEEGLSGTGWTFREEMGPGGRTMWAIKPPE